MNFSFSSSSFPSPTVNLIIIRNSVLRGKNDAIAAVEKLENKK